MIFLLSLVTTITFFFPSTSTRFFPDSAVLPESSCAGQGSSPCAETVNMANNATVVNNVNVTLDFWAAVRVRLGRRIIMLYFLYQWGNKGYQCDILFENELTHESRRLRKARMDPRREAVWNLLMMRFW